jgi:hypothetical protein
MLFSYLYEQPPADPYSLMGPSIGRRVLVLAPLFAGGGAQGALPVLGHGIGVSGLNPGGAAARASGYMSMMSMIAEAYASTASLNAAADVATASLLNSAAADGPASAWAAAAAAAAHPGGGERVNFTRMAYCFHDEGDVWPLLSVRHGPGSPPAAFTVEVCAGLLIPSRPLLPSSSS